MVSRIQNWKMRNWSKDRKIAFYEKEIASHRVEIEKETMSIKESRDCISRHNQEIAELVSLIRSESLGQ